MNASSKKNKIALFLLPLLTQGGGAEKYFIELAKNLRGRGFEADVITMDNNFFRKFARLLHIFVLGNFLAPIDIKGRESENEIKSRLGEARWIQTSYNNLATTLRKYDVVYSRNEISELGLLKVQRLANLPPVIVGVHTPLSYPEAGSFIAKLHNFLYRGIIYKLLLNGVKLIHVSNSAAKEFVEKYFKVKAKLIFYPFSADEIVKVANKFKSNIKFDEARFNVAFVGRLSEQKGIGSLAKIAKLISEDSTIAEKIQINIFGSGTEEHENIVRGLVNEYSFIEYFGHVENKYILDILSKHQLLISTSKWETLPYNVLEAQGLGLPVIAFDIPGPQDIIDDGQTGFLVKDEQEFFGKIKSIAGRKSTLRREVILENIQTKFFPDEIYGEIEQMFLEIAK